MQMETTLNKEKFKSIQEIFEGINLKMTFKKKRLVIILVVIFFIVSTIYSFLDKNETIVNVSFNPIKEDSCFQINIKDKYYEIERFGSGTSSKITVISQYFELNKSKHSRTEYLIWLRNLFLSVSSPLIIFTNSKNPFKDLIEERIKRKYHTTLYITATIWNIMKENELIRNRNYTYSYQNKQQLLDREKIIHNPNLYALWNLKSFICAKVAQENFYESSTFIYTDSGAFRSRVYEDWPDEEFVMQVKDHIQDKMLFGQLSDEKVMLKKQRFPDLDLIEGTFFMGTKKALLSFKEEFWRIHDKLFDEEKFVGKDQTLMNIYAFANSSNSVKLKVWERLCTEEYDEWFFYQCYFAKQAFYSCSNPKMSLLS